MLVLVVWGLSTHSCQAQRWAEAMFDHRSHDFGVVVRGQKVEHRFPFKNIYVEDVHIDSVTSTCGCTVPKVTKNHLKTYETGEIVATINTKQFLGRKQATLRVRISQPFPAEVQLHCSVYIRSDVVLHPGSVQFGTVLFGTGAEAKTVTVSYAGRNDWQITSVQCANPHLVVKIVETRREFGRVDYQLHVALKADAPVGYIRDQVILITNDHDPKSQRVPVLVEGVVSPAVSVRPSPLLLGVLSPGQQVTRTLVVQGMEPFRIVKITGPDDRFTFKFTDEEKPLHVIPVTFKAGEKPGKVSGSIVIETNMVSHKQIEAAVEGQVIEAVSDEEPGSVLIEDSSAGSHVTDRRNDRCLQGIPQSR